MDLELSLDISSLILCASDHMSSRIKTTCHTRANQSTNQFGSESASDQPIHDCTSFVLLLIAEISPARSVLAPLLTLRSRRPKTGEMGASKAGSSHGPSRYSVTPIYAKVQDLTSLCVDLVQLGRRLLGLEVLLRLWRAQDK